MTTARSVPARVPTASRLVWEPGDGRLARRPDELAVEEPLEVRVGVGAATRVLNVTMRTPGSDFELAAGWLLAEGVITGPEELKGVRYCTDPELDAEQRYNAVTADLVPAALERLQARATPGRLTATTSACGVCGSASIDALAALGPAELAATAFPLADVLSWPARLREAQAAFAATGGLHAAGLLDADGEIRVVREDIGRHNAVDKVLGWAVLEAAAGRERLPLSRLGLVVSGRSSFEIVQKALSAGLPLVASVSAASSLAVELATERGLTLVGFVRDGRCTVYSCPERLS